MTTKEIPNLLNKTASNHFLNLKIPEGKTILTYIWINADDEEKICSKLRTYDGKPNSVSEISIWTDSKYDKNHDVVEIFLEPVKIYKDPFFGGDNLIVLCETYSLEQPEHHRKPLDSNRRPICMKLAERSASSEPWFGIEQEYTLLGINHRPLGWPDNGFRRPKGLFFYNGVGFDRVIGRQVSEAHYMACLYSGLSICGTSAEVMPAQWEYQIGPIAPVDVCDQLIVSRFLLARVAEDFGVIITFDPKPIKDWSGSSCHTNFSTNKMRSSDAGLKEMQKAIEKLELKHMNHLEEYDPKKGQDNERRMKGTHCAPSGDFVAGFSKTLCSVRIPKTCLMEQKGYIEDRRPASNCNPYRVINSILKTVILNE